jgi:hypothetical protein
VANGIVVVKPDANADANRAGIRRHRANYQSTPKATIRLMYFCQS